MDNFAWAIPHNITLQGHYNLKYQQYSLFSQIMLPLSISSLLTYSHINLRNEIRIIQFSPLKMINCRFTSSQLFFESNSNLFFDKTEFNFLSKSIKSINAPLASITHCSFSEVKAIPFISEGTQKVRIKWNNFQDFQKTCAISIKNADDARLETNNFTNLDCGGILAISSDMLIRGCIFESNSGMNGGSIEMVKSKCNLSFCLFSNCDSDKGGAVYADNCDSKLMDCLFAQNFANSGYSIFTNTEISIYKCNFTGNSNLEINGPANLYESKFDYKDIHIKFGPPPTSTFSPSPSKSPVPEYQEKYFEPKSDKSTLIISLCCGIGGGVIVIAIIFLIIARVKNINNPKIYVAEGTTESKPPTGSAYIVSTNSQK